MVENLTEAKQHIIDWVKANKGDFYRLSDAIWSYAELGMEEIKSSQALASYLKAKDFSLEPGVADMSTAFVATWGSGKPVIAFSAEYDALPGLSQEKGISDESPIIQGAPGQGCGHNLLGVGSIMAAMALRSAMMNFGLRGTIKIFGTPAEEICIGKPFMARVGLFGGIDVVLDWHPFFLNSADYTTCNAYFSIRYHFKGRTSHGNRPWDGRSALDAAVLTGNMIEFLREHITPGNPPWAANTINYSFPNVGPAFPVVVPNMSTLWCVGRIATSEEAEYIIDRLHRCTQAAAMATETTVETELISATHERIPNRVISTVLYNNLQVIGAPKFTEDENDFAKKLQRDNGTPDTGLDSEIMPLSGGSQGVSDNSEYSWFAPMGMLLITAAPGGIGWHNWQVAASVGTTIGKKAMDTAAQVLAASGVDLLLEPNIIDEAKKELAERLQGRDYASLIPEAVKPQILINRDLMDQYRPLQEKYYQEL